MISPETRVQIRRYFYAEQLRSDAAEIRFLVDHGYIEPLDIEGLGDQLDLTKIVRLTPVGEYYVERERSEARTATA